MTPRFPSPPRRLRQAGVGLVTAIFLLVVLAALAVAMVSVYSAQQASSNLDLQGARAYQAARAGLEWGLFRQLRTNPAGCIGGATFNMPAGTSLSGFTVVVGCTQRGRVGGLLQVTLTSTACNIVDGNGGCGAVSNPESVRRTVEAQVTQPQAPGAQP